jgi:hypothetical protein
MKNYQAFQKLLMGDTQSDRQTGDLISLLSFMESRLKIDDHKKIFRKIPLFACFQFPDKRPSTVFAAIHKHYIASSKSHVIYAVVIKMLYCL